MNELEYQGILLNSDVNYKWDNYTLREFIELINVTSNGTNAADEKVVNNWWALVAIALVVCTAAGNVLVCLAIYLERRLQNVTNYFLMSLAITDLLVAVLVMPVGILTLVRGESYLYNKLINFIILNMGLCFKTSLDLRFNGHDERF